MDVRKSFGKVVKEARIARVWSQELLASRSKLHRTYITDIERGERNLTLENIAKLADGLGISIAQLFPDEPAERDEAEHVLNGSDPLDILLVEDNSMDIDLTIAGFRQAKLANRIQVVRDGAAALEYLFGRNGDKPKRGLPAAVLLDLNLPRVSGIEVLRSIMADSKTRDIKVVVLTASKSEDDAREAMRLGASGYITKPVDFHNFSQIASKLGFWWTLLRPDHGAMGHNSVAQTHSQGAFTVPANRPEFALPALNSPPVPRPRP